MRSKFYGKYNSNVEVMEHEGYLYVTTGSGYSGRARIRFDIEGYDVIDALSDGKAVVSGKYADPTEGEKLDLSIEYAMDVASEDPDLLFAASDDAISGQAAMIALNPTSETEPGRWMCGEWIED